MSESAKITPSLEDNITVLSGVGEKRAQALNALGIFTIADLLEYFPFQIGRASCRERV